MQLGVLLTIGLCMPTGHDARHEAEHVDGHKAEHGAGDEKNVFLHLNIKT